MTKKTAALTARCKDVSITNNDWEKFEAAALIKFNEEDRRELFSVINAYFVEECFYLYAASPRETKSALRSIRNLTNRLHRKLEQYDLLEVIQEKSEVFRGKIDLSTCSSDFWDLEIDTAIKIAVDHQLMGIAKIATMKLINSTYSIEYDDSSLSNQFVSVMRDHLYKLIKITEEIEAEISDEDGAAGDPYLNTLLSDLLREYQRCTGSALKDSAFYNLVFEVAKFLEFHFLAAGFSPLPRITIYCHLDDEEQAEYLRDGIRKRISSAKNRRAED